MKRSIYILAAFGLGLAVALPLNTIEARAGEVNSKPNPAVKVTGQAFVMPPSLKQGEPVTQAEQHEFRKKMLADFKAKYPDATTAKTQPDELPKIAKTRGGATRIQNPRGSVYGKGGIFQYVNSDTQYPTNSCGQSALATLMVYWGLRSPDISNAPVREVCRMFPPGFYGKGDGGTWVGTLERAFSYYGMKYTWRGGSWNWNQLTRYNEDKNELKKWVAQGYPVMVPVDVAKAGWTNNGQTMNGLHWTVVFAYDDGGVYLTNWQGSNYCSWSQFMNGWEAESVVWTTRRGQMMLSWVDGKNPPSWPPGT